MKVFVIMSNDFPDAVFAEERLAEQYCKEANEAPENQRPGSTARRIYYRVFGFDLLEQLPDGRR